MRLIRLYESRWYEYLQTPNTVSMTLDYFRTFYVPVMLFFSSAVFFFFEAAESKVSSTFTGQSLLYIPMTSIQMRSVKKSSLCVSRSWWIKWWDYTLGKMGSELTTAHVFRLASFPSMLFLSPRTPRATCCFQDIYSVTVANTHFIEAHCSEGHKLW